MTIFAFEKSLLCARESNLLKHPLSDLLHERFDVFPVSLRVMLEVLWRP